MPLILPGNVGSATAATGFNVANSCLFHRADSADMTLSMSSGGSQTKFTKSFWIKRCKTGEQHYIYDNSGTTQIFFHFRDTDKIGLGIFNSGAYSTELISTQLFRDVSAWYHFVIAVDYTNGTQAHRARIYVNGTEITAFDTETRPGNTSTTFDTFNSSKTHYIGSNASTNHYLHGYLAEVVHIDNAQLAPTSFGEFDSDSGIWKPIDVSGLTFGTKGYYLDFEASDNLGNDANGGTDWTENNLAATDQSTDTCTNNFATLNPVVRSNNITFAEGNLKITGDGSANFSGSHGTIAVNSGKWYCEVKVTNAENLQIGALIINSSSSGDATGTGSGGMYYYYENIYWQDNNTAIKVANSPESGANASVTGGSNSVNTYSTDIISMALDMDNGRIYFAKNGTYENSGNPANGTNAFNLPTNYNDGNGMTFYAGLHEAAVEMNFGSPAYAISSGNTDANGYGNFEYAVPSGYFSLNTKNLAEYG